MHQVASIYSCQDDSTPKSIEAFTTLKNETKFFNLNHGKLSCKPKTDQTCLLSLFPLPLQNQHKLTISTPLQESSDTFVSLQNLWTLPACSVGEVEALAQGNAATKPFTYPQNYHTYPGVLRLQSSPLAWSFCDANSPQQCFSWRM